MATVQFTLIPHAMEAAATNPTNLPYADARPVANAIQAVVRVLTLTYDIGPIVAGLNKFTNLLTNIRGLPRARLNENAAVFMPYVHTDSRHYRNNGRCAGADAAPHWGVVGDDLAHGHWPNAAGHWPNAAGHRSFPRRNRARLCADCGSLGVGPPECAHPALNRMNRLARRAVIASE